MKIMTMNVWSDYMDNPIEPREDGLYNAVMNCSPDVFGVQEFSSNFHHCSFFEEIKKDYTCIEIYDKNNTPVFFKKDKFEMLECGWIWYEGIPLPFTDKGITWVVLCDKETNKNVGILSTHLWFKEGEEHDRLRDKNAKQLLDKMKYIKDTYKAPVFAFGDFNCTLGSSTLNYLEENNVFSSYKLTDDFCRAATYHGYPQKGDDGKFHGETTQDDYTNSLDHIITFKDDSVKIIKQDALIYPEILGATDHSPVYIDVEF